MANVELILLDSEQEYRNLYLDIFVDKQYLLRGVPVAFNEKSFDHIFSEPARENKQRCFSKRRAKRLMFIKAILQNIVSFDLMYESDTENIAVFCDDLECVMYLNPIRKDNKLQVVTFFDFGKDHSKMRDKQKRKCTPLTDVQFRKIFEGC